MSSILPSPDLEKRIQKIIDCLKEAWREIRALLSQPGKLHQRLDRPQEPNDPVYISDR
jgi:hypothetical protein